MAGIAAWVVVVVYACIREHSDEHNDITIQKHSRSNFVKVNRQGSETIEFGGGIEFRMTTARLMGLEELSNIVHLCWLSYHTHHLPICHLNNRHLWAATTTSKKSGGRKNFFLSHSPPTTLSRVIEKMMISREDS